MTERNPVHALSLPLSRKPSKASPTSAEILLRNFVLSFKQLAWRLLFQFPVTQDDIVDLWPRLVYRFRFGLLHLQAPPFISVPDVLHVRERGPLACSCVEATDVGGGRTEGLVHLCALVNVAPGSSSNGTKTVLEHVGQWSKDMVI